MNKIYFNNYKIKKLDNSRYAITDIESNIIQDLDGIGFKTKKKAFNVIKYSYELKTHPVPFNHNDEYKYIYVEVKLSYKIFIYTLYEIIHKIFRFYK
jgi:hypothetical protein